MSYDWEKIFENKTNKEVYEIYSGKSMLPDETEIFARHELERRNFDFNNMEANKSAWELSNLLLEEESAQKVINENKIKIIPYKNLYIFIPGIFIVYIFLLKVLNFDISILYPILMIVITLFYVPFTNRIYVKQKGKQKNKIERINKLKEKLEENVPPAGTRILSRSDKIKKL